jgi:hypothetical protein
MAAELRRQERKGLGYPAYLRLGGELVGCQMSDVSAGGARLAVENGFDVPAHVTLLLSLRGPERDCSVMWRAPHEIGVKFDRGPRKPLEF